MLHLWLLLLLLLHLLLLRRCSEYTWLWLASLRRWPSEGVEWVLAHWPLHTWLVSVHSHTHTHATHAHSSHVLLLGHHGVRLAHLIHATHSLHAAHWLEWHRLETAGSGRLLHRAKGVCLRRLLVLLRLISVHELGEGICSRQLLLRLELIRLRPCRLLIIIVKALQHRKLVSVRYRGRVGSQRLISRREDIAERIRGLAWGGFTAACGRICREYVE